MALNLVNPWPKSLVNIQSYLQTFMFNLCAPVRQAAGLI